MKTNETSYKKDVDEAPLSEDQVIALRTNTLSTRMKLAIYAELEGKRRFPKLEALTGIPINTWRSWWKNGSNPSGALVEALAKLWPQYAYWLVTGNTDIRCGHDMPNLHPAARGYICNSPEEFSERNKEIKKQYSKAYLQTAIDLEKNQSEYNENLRIKGHSLKFISEERIKEINSNFEIEIGFDSKYVYK